MCSLESEKRQKNKEGMEVVSKKVNGRVRMERNTMQIKEKHQISLASQLLNRVRENSNVIPSQFHNPSISETFSPAHPFNALALYLFSTYKMIWGSHEKQAGIEGNTRGLGSCRTALFIADLTT